MFRNLIAVLFISFAGAIHSSEHIYLPPEGMTSAASILKCESEVKKLKGFQEHRDNNGNGYFQINSGSDSFMYLFTSPAEPAHPAMIKITIHPLTDPLRPQKGEIEFFGAYAGDEEEFHVWRKRVLYNFGRGFGAGVFGESHNSEVKSEQQ